MTTTAAPDLERRLVGRLRATNQVIAQAEIDRLQLVVEWAQLHQAPFDHNPEDVGFGSRYLPLAGPAAPLVEESAVTDLAASLGMSDHAGRELVAQALELRYRLPRLWRRVKAGKVATWKATGTPHGGRSARRCDLDHVVPYDTGGPTSTDNLAPLCRHHRVKAFGWFSYRVLGPGAYEWTLPSGWRVLRDHRGTHPPVPPDPPQE